MSSVKFLEKIILVYRTWKRALSYLDIYKKKHLIHRKYSSFVLAVLEEKLQGNPLEMSQSDKVIFINIYSDYFVNGDIHIEIILSKIREIFGGWNEAIIESKKLHFSDKMKTYPRMIENFLKNLHYLGHDISSLKSLNEIDDDIWDELISKHFGRVLGKNTFHSYISITHNGIENALINLNLKVVYRHPGNSKEGIYLEILENLYRQGIDVSTPSALYANENMTLLAISSISKRNFEVATLIHHLNEKYGSYYKAYCKLNHPLKGVKAASINRYQSEIKAEMELVGIDKTGNFFKNRLNFIDVVYKITGNFFDKKIIARGTVSLYGNDSLYFQELPSHDNIEEIFFSKIKQSNWKYLLHTHKENFNFIREILEEIFGVKVNAGRVYRYIISLELDHSNFDLNLDLVNVIEMETINQDHFNELYNPKLDTHQYMGNPLTILEENLYAQNNIIKRILLVIPFKDSSFAYIVLDSILSYNLVSASEVQSYLPNSNLLEIEEVFTTIKNDKEIFLNLIRQ